MKIFHFIWIILFGCVVELYSQTSPKNQHIIHANEVNQLARSYLEQDKLLEAEPLFLQVLPIFETHYEKEDPDYIQLLSNLMSLYLELNNLKKSKYYANQLKQIFETATNPKPSLAVQISNILHAIEQLEKIDLSNTQSMEGLETVTYDISYAISENASKEDRIKRLKELLEKQKAISGAYSFEVMNLNLALYKNHLDEIDHALYYLSEYQKILKKQAESKIHFFTEKERELWWKRISLYLLDLKASSISEVITDRYEPRLLGYTYNSELFSKSTLLTSSQKLRQAIFSSNDTNLISEWNKLSKLIENNNKSDEDFILQLEKSIISKSQIYRENQLHFDTEWTDIHKSLDSGEVAIEFLMFNGFLGDDYQNIYLALLIRADLDFPELVWYSVENDILEAMKSEDKDALYNELWEPIEQYLENNDVIYLAPTGLLHTVSFGGLSYQNGKYYLCEDYTFHNLLSTRDIIKLKQKKDIEKTKHITFFGGADYNLSANELSSLDADLIKNVENNLNRSLLDEMDPTRGPGFSYLPGSKREVLQIEKHLSGLKWKTSLFSDQKATETRFKSLSSNQSPEVIHLSTHGFYFPQPKENFEPENFSTSSNINPYRLFDNPLMRSGLAFAGANHVWRGLDSEERTDDGILTAYEISNMNLSNTELVVLSACNTGLGDIDHSEGVFGLQRAFRLAGVQTMIVSLWEVPDKETTELMTEFYSLWSSGLTKKDAFDQAKIKMRYAYPDQPKKWAGFIMIE